MSDELLLRFTDDFEIRTEDDGTRFVEGYAVPWGQTINVRGVKERFERGAFGPEGGVGQPFYGEHAHRTGGLPVGMVVRAEDREKGHWFRAELVNTPRADEVHELFTRKVFRKLSVGFAPEDGGVRVDEDGVHVYTRARFAEVSGTAFPAYTEADVTNVRSRTATPREDTMPTTDTADLATAEDVTELRSTIAAMERQLAVLGDNSGGGDGAAAVLNKYRSLGAVVKALAPAKGRGREISDDDLLELRNAYDDAMELRAYTGATTADLGSTLKAAWIDRDVKMITERRRIFEQFSSERLPADGMSVEYPKFGSKTGDVAKQAAEGDDLTYLELIVTTATAAVDTYGGYSQLTRQVIERSSIAYLNKVLAMQRASYAKTTNGAIRTVLTGLGSTNTDTLPFADLAKAKAWTGRVIKAASDFEANSVSGGPDLWIMGLTHFTQMAAVEDNTGRPMFVVNGGGGQGVNTIGGVNLRLLEGNVAGLPVFLDPGLTGTFSYICNREALTTLESGPFSLTDENIVNLTKAFSLYGYLSVTANDAKGVTKVSHPAA